MAAETIAGSKVLEDVFQNVRRAAESSLKMHQEIFHQWTHMWPFPTPQSVWIDKVRDFQKQFAVTVSDLARKHREVVDKQFQAGDRIARCRAARRRGNEPGRVSSTDRAIVPQDARLHARNLGNPA